ncbi:unnamed protein product [Ilex paraguariensis]|uniref:Secreted protein n=1 Tax=Ilex paraguariensis TaxID=185542 RepID=A0ABC8RY89_9AQUA
MSANTHSPVLAHAPDLLLLFLRLCFLSPSYSLSLSLTILDQSAKRHSLLWLQRYRPSDAIKASGCVRICGAFFGLKKRWGQVNWPHCG